MSAPASRRGFLRGLTTLPLIGGGVALSTAASFASSAELAEGEQAFLAVAPTVLQMLKVYRPLHAEMRRIWDASEAAIGDHPGWEIPGAAHAWCNRCRDWREANGYTSAWSAMSEMSDKISAIVDPFEDVAMRTMPAIMLKALLVDVSDFWADEAAADLYRTAEAQLCA